MSESEIALYRQSVSGTMQVWSAVEQDPQLLAIVRPAAMRAIAQRSRRPVELAFNIDFVEEGHFSCPKAEWRGWLG